MPEATKDQDYVAEFSLSVLFSLGFRPFYLAGSLYAIISMAIWISYLSGYVSLAGPLDGVLWHAHELIFGFAVAILFGFLFTAVSNWTRRPTPSGWWLAGILFIWATGRLGLAVSSSPIVMIIDLAFLPLAAIGIALPLIRSRNRRNYFVLGLIGILWCANLGFYAAAYEWVEIDGEQFYKIAIGIFALFISIIGGRVVPFFTNNALGEKRSHRYQSLEHASAAAIALSITMDLAFTPQEGPNLLHIGILLTSTLLQLAKILAWRPWIMLSRPILWILPLSYAWLPIGFFLRALSLFDFGIDTMLGLHAITVGAMGGMMLAMMTRSSLGHTGRAIHATPTDIAIYIAITGGAVIRVFGPLVLPDHYVDELSVSAALWCAAFLLFCVRYWPILSRPRFF